MVVWGWVAVDGANRWVVTWEEDGEETIWVEVMEEIWVVDGEDSHQWEVDTVEDTEEDMEEEDSTMDGDNPK